MTKTTPNVDQASTFFEIASDFRDPLDAVREAISNAFDAGAKEIRISATMADHRGQKELVVQFQDDGVGMDQIRLIQKFQRLRLSLI
jgi:hypothetical protein